MTQTPRLVVALGASAGGLQALSSFFEALPNHTGMTFIVAQHLSPDFKSMMPELLARYTDMPILLAENDTPLRPDHVYLNSPKSDLIVEKSTLRVIPWDTDTGIHRPIDVLFRSLGNDLAERAVAIVLSGSGTDGAEGLRHVYRSGGFTICQTPESAEFNGMPSAALSTESVHVVTKSALIPEVLRQHLENPFESQGPVEPLSDAAGAMDTIFAMLRKRFRIDFRQYKPTTAGRRVVRRADFSNLNIEGYANKLKEDPEELDRLYWDLLIGVTHFFRDEAAFDCLNTEVIQKLAVQATPDSPVRVWVAGCATGEEAYSVAMLLAEAIGDCQGFQVFATDVHTGSLRHASLGIYPRAQEEVPPHLLDKYFVKSPQGWRVRSELRQTIVFAPHDVLSDAPFSRVDLVTCRNLLIYLRAAVQTKVLARLHFALRLGGTLFLGPSETLGALAEDYEPVERRWNVFRKSRDQRRTIGMRAPNAVVPQRPIAMREAPPAPDLLAAYDKLLERFAPPGFLIDLNRTLLHTFGEAGDFLEIPKGRASSDLLALLSGPLRSSMGAAIHRAISDARPVTFSAKIEETHYEVRVGLLGSPGRSANLLITFGEPPEPESLTATRLSPPDQNLATDDRVRKLENELAWTRETLQTTVESADVTNEELQATNEELVASNEELQSTNEELQSVNEELHTVNAEYQEKNVQLRALTADLEQLLKSTDIGVIFLDRELRIRRFTQAATKLFNLLPQDIGRPLEHISNRIPDIDIRSNITQVMETSEHVEHSVEVGDGQTFLLRALPYRPGLQDIEGIVLSFVDISEVARAERRVREMERQLRSILETVPSNILFANNQLVIGWANELAARAFETTPEALVGQHLFDANPDLRSREPLYREVLTGTEHNDSEVSFLGSYFDVGYRPVYEDSRITGLVAISTDVTDRVKFLQQLRDDAAVINHVPHRILILKVGENSEDPSAYTITFGNTAAARAFGVSQIELEEMPFQRAMPSFVASGLHEHFQNVFLSGKSLLVEVEYGDSRVPNSRLRMHVHALSKDRLLVMHEDVSEEVRVREQNAANGRLEAIGQIAGGVAHDLNNMLGAILMTGRAVRADLPQGSTAEEDIEAIIAMTHKAADLVARLLDFSRQRPVQPKCISIHDTVASIGPMLERILGSSVQVALETDQESTVFLDPTVLEQVLVNLATNARFAMEHGGTFSIASRIVDSPTINGRSMPGEFAELVVRDTGIGMDEATLSRCFDPFFTTRARGVGSGMGLAMVQGVIQQAGGAISAHSRLGSGTSFHMVFPLHRAAPDREQPRSRPTTPRRILLVDDEKMLRHATARNLRRNGHAVLEAESGEHAIEVFASHPDCEVLITDVLMPGINGPTLADTLRTGRPNLPVVFISGYSAHAAVRNDVWDGAKYLSKPFTQEELEQAIAAVCEAAN